VPQDTRITVMIHGYKFAPGEAHRHILSFCPTEDDRRAVSWPKHLRVGPDHMGIALGWTSTGTLWHAWNEAERAGTTLARVLDLLASMGRKADIVAHSLGARVALAGMRQAPAGSVGRAILIAPAEFRTAAEAAMTSPAGRTADVLNVTSRENDIFDTLLEWLIAPHVPGARSLGVGLRVPVPNWTELRIDDDQTLATLAGLGYRVAPPVRRVCHWSGYLRPGLFPLYRAILSDRLSMEALRTALPARRARSRIVERLGEWAPLPFTGKAPL
jgi:pimeloyl-ACP methyl ester carboxylesterase